MSENHAEHAAHESHHHISPSSLYWTVWVGLMILTAITVLAYYIPVWLNLKLGAGNVVIAMVIATTKASLVCLFFMGLKYDKKFNLIAFLSSLIFLGLFLSFTLLDINTREDQQPFLKPIYAGKELPMESESHSEGAKEAAPAAAPASAGAASEGGAKKEEAKEGAKTAATAAASTSPAASATKPAPPAEGKKK